MSAQASEAGAYDAWAEVYDASDGDRAPFVAFYAGLLRPDTRSLLELGCGTGSILQALAQPLRAMHPQARIVGVDGSEGMLAVARRRDAGIEWRLGDLRDPGVDGRFDLVLCVFNTLQHLLLDADLGRAFAAARAKLASGGRYAFDLYRPNLDYLRIPQRDRMARAFTDRNGRALEIREDSNWDESAQLLELDWRLVHAEAPASEPIAATHFRLRQYQPQVLERELAAAGLRIVERFGDFDRSALDSNSRKQLLVCVAD